MKKRNNSAFLSLPYIIFMVVFTLIPLGVVAYYALTDPATGEFVPGGVTEQTTQCFENIKNVLAEAGLTTANIVKTTVFLADMSLFAEMNAVYATYFEGDFPARSAFAVKALPKGALVEIESIAVR